MFSTKAEYGVRVMAHLARSDAGKPIPLGSIAEAEGLPLAYLEHLVQRLRRAELVESRRGAHGGYTLARAGRGASRWPRSCARSRATSPRSSASPPTPTARSSASARASAGHDPCPTKLLWTRVQGSIVRTLNDMTLADLVQPADPKTNGDSDRMSLEIQNLHVRTEEREILHGVDLASRRARPTR